MSNQEIGLIMLGLVVFLAARSIVRYFVVAASARLMQTPRAWRAQPLHTWARLITRRNTHPLSMHWKRTSMMVRAPQ